MTLSVLVTYSNYFRHLHCFLHHAKFKIIVLSTVHIRLTLTQKITDNLQFLILRDPYAHLGGDLQNIATYTLSRKASILENCICQVLQSLHFLMLPQSGGSLELKSSKKVERNKKKQKVYKFVFIIFHHHHNMQKFIFQLSL